MRPATGKHALVRDRPRRVFGMMLRLTAALALALLATGAPAQFDHSHAAWGALLAKHVRLVADGKASQVHYGGFQSDRAALKAYLDALGRVSAAQFKRWSKHQRLAFLINAYNAAVIEKVLTRYPDIASIWDFGKLFGNPFKDKFIQLLGEAVSLDNIEHDLIRANGVYNEPRIHFAVNCASIGCPMLREEPYRGERLDAQLEEQTVRFLSDRTRNRYNAADQTLEVSKLFDWYGDDFRRGWKGYTALEAFFAQYAHLLADAAREKQRIRGQIAAVRHLDYDWGLNAAPR